MAKHADTSFALAVGSFTDSQPSSGPKGRIGSDRCHDVPALGEWVSLWSRDLGVEEFGQPDEREPATPQAIDDPGKGAGGEWCGVAAGDVHDDDRAVAS